MENNILLNNENYPSILRVMQASLSVQNHFQLLLWLQGELQELLPHEALISISGDFTTESLHYDIVSPLPGVRTEKLSQCSIHNFRNDFHSQWKRNNESPKSQSAAHGFSTDDENCELNQAFRTMKHAAFHAISDARFKADHLYVLLRRETPFSASELSLLALLLPHIDSAVRKIEGLPELHPDQMASQQVVSQLMKAGLTPREIEILEWVRNGKTNIEIGMILDISAFTVKNHLQRIFKKINVTNRAQAVGELEKLASGKDSLQTGNLTGNLIDNKPLLRACGT